MELKNKAILEMQQPQNFSPLYHALMQFVCFMLCMIPRLRWIRFSLLAIWASHMDGLCRVWWQR